MAEPHDVEKTAVTIVQPIYEKTPQTPSEPETVLRRPTKLEKLGTYNIVVLVLGTVAILLSFSFLAFIWYASVYKRVTTSELQPVLWIDIVYANWTTKTITIATVLIRAAITAQLCVFAAIMAALILEKAGGSSTADFPLLSMVRCANSGPQALIKHVWHTITTGTQLGYSLIIIVAILNALALQFTSTIFLLDFEPTDTILGDWPANISLGLHGGNISSVMQATDYWKSGSSSFPAFAELSQKGSTNLDYVDTGKTYRGLLPFDNSTIRMSTRKYVGPMLVMDERVICTKPNMSEVTAYYGSWTRKLLLNGTVDIANSHPDIVLLDDGEHDDFDTTQVNFSCSLPVQDEDLPSGWVAAALCVPTIYPNIWMKGGIFGNELPEWNNETQYFDLHGKDLNTATMWLFMTIKNTTNYYDSNSDDLANDNSNYYWKEDSGKDFTTLPRLSLADGPWAQFGQDDKNIDISVCFWQPNTNTFNVTAEGVPQFDVFGDHEPYIGWDQDEQSLDTWEAQLQLGALNISAEYSVEQRGLLKLHNSNDWFAKLSGLKNETEDGAWGLDLELTKTPNDLESDMTLQLADPNGVNAESIHGTLMALGQATLDDPSITLQVLTHVTMQQVYYEWIESWDATGGAILDFVQTRNVPTQWTCFGVVLGLVGLHLALVLTAVVFFLTSTEMSLLGNAWQVVAQCHSSDTAPTVEKGYMATDKELKAYAKSSGIQSERIRIGKSNQGRNEALRYNRNPSPI